MVDFTFCDTPFTTVNVYAPAVAAVRAAYFMQQLLPHLPQLLVSMFS
jgi:hypothetical protein